MKQAFYVAVLLFGAFLFLFYWQSIVDLTVNHTAALLVTIVLSGVAACLQSFNFLLLFDQKRRPPLIPTIEMWSASQLLNYVAPFQPGIGLRAVFLKSFNIGIAETLQQTARWSLITIWWAMGLFASVADVIDDSRLNIVGSLALFVFFTAPVALFIIKLLENKPFIPKKLQQSAVLRQVSVWVVLLCLLQVLLLAVTYTVVYNLVGIDLKYSEGLIVACTLILASLISITPNGVGITDVVVGAVAYRSGAAAELSIALPFLLRLGHVLSCVSVIIICRFATYLKKGSS
jgi:hypothetical protein